VKAVLDDLGLGNAVERQARSAVGVVTGQQDGIF
jgi:hypothetical protein